MQTEKANDWSATLKALAHPTRLQIVAELLNGTKCVTDMEEILPASQANISQHMAVLRHAGLVDFAQDGALRLWLRRIVSPHTRGGIDSRALLARWL